MKALNAGITKMTVDLDPFFVLCVFFCFVLPNSKAENVDTEIVLWP